jgi:N-methylhydantoinase B
MRTSASLDAHIDRTRFPPWGLEGGMDGAPNSIHVETAGGEVRRPDSGKIHGWPVSEGDTYVIRSGGGGGFGDPLARPVERVAEDVRRGYVSREAAADDYGVVLGEDGEAVPAETERLRRGRRQGGAEPA